MGDIMFRKPIMIAGLLILIVLVLSGGAASVQVTASLSDASKDADVSPDRDPDSTTTFEGVIDISDTNYDTQTNVSLRATNSNGWPSEIYPSLFSANGTKQVFFTYNITAPIETSRSTITTISIMGTWNNTDGEDGDVNSAQAVLGILQFYRFDIQLDTTSISTSPSEPATVVATLTNTGNDEDDFSFNILNETELTALGFNFTESRTSITVTEGTSQTWTLKIKGPSKQPAVINFEFYSKGGKMINSNSSIFKNITVTGVPKKNGSDDTPDFSMFLAITAITCGVFFRRMRLK